ncbi:ABC transporter permease [Amycolatopsis sp. NPDC001319]|uniref:ABC transporter permease n=1 Tax=unclassified Amycolatopsis TaxID=2618356 RepID=UPI0036BECBEA
MTATTSAEANRIVPPSTKQPRDPRSLPRRRRLRKAGSAGVSLVYLVAALVLGIGIWQAAVAIYHPASYIIPAPLDVWHAFTTLVWSDAGDPTGMWSNLGSTMQATLIGFVIGSAAGVLFGVLAGEFAIVRRLIYPYLVAIQSLPKVALGPVLATWFGFGLEAKTSLVVLFVFFPVLVNTLQGVVTADPDRIDLMRSLSGGRLQQLYRIRLYSAMPSIFTGLELGIVYAFLGAVLAEMTGAQKGVGVMISQFQQNSDTQATFALLIILAVVGYLLNMILRFVHTRVVFWEAGNGNDFRSTSANS